MRRGRLSARERLARLIDAGSFREMGALVTPEQDDDGARGVGRARAQSPADGVVVGTAPIDGRPVVIFSQDFSVHGGSIGKLGSAKTQRALQIAITPRPAAGHGAGWRRPSHPGRPGCAPLRPCQRHVPQFRPRLGLDPDGGADAGRGLRRPDQLCRPGRLRRHGARRSRPWGWPGRRWSRRRPARIPTIWPGRRRPAGRPQSASPISASTTRTRPSPRRGASSPTCRATRARRLPVRSEGAAADRDRRCHARPGADLGAQGLRRAQGAGDDRRCRQRASS